MSGFPRVRLSIRRKLLLSFTLVVFVGLSALLLVSVRITDQNISRIIDRDMIQMKKNIDLYLRQYYLTRNMTMDEQSFRSEADGLVKQLSEAVGSPVSVYDAAGRGLSDLNTEQLPAAADFADALHGQTAYSVRRSGAAASVSLSSPAESGGTAVGIVHVVKDYSELSDFSRRFLAAIRWFAAAIFVFVFATAAALARRIARPIDRLVHGVRRVSEGVYEPVPADRGRDEIGELSRSFNLMVAQIRSQIAIIERERDAVQAAQATSKAFFDNVTHELKTPLTTIRGYAQIMLENGFTEKAFFDKGMRYIMDESRRLNDKVVQIVEYSVSATGRDAFRQEAVDLTAVIREVGEDMGVKAGKYGMRIVCEAENGLILNGDGGKLREMLLNVVDNAVKYGGAGKPVTIAAGRDEAGRVVVHVTDRGPGIPAEQLPRLFEPFYRAGAAKKDEERGSAGLGLAIARNIAERHGGDVTIHSRPGIGTTVTIRLGGADHG